MSVWRVMEEEDGSFWRLHRWQLYHQLVVDRGGFVCVRGARSSCCALRCGAISIVRGRKSPSLCHGATANVMFAQNSLPRNSTGYLEIPKKGEEERGGGEARKIFTFKR